MSKFKLAAFVAPLLMVATLASADVRVYLQTGPPHAVVEHRPSSPGADYVWIAGHHSWDGRSYVWVSGHWEARPHRHAHWRNGNWQRDHHRGWYWTEGGWR